MVAGREACDAAAEAGSSRSTIGQRPGSQHTTSGAARTGTRGGRGEGRRAEHPVQEHAVRRRASRAGQSNRVIAELFLVVHFFVSSI